MKTIKQRGMKGGLIAALNQQNAEILEKEILKKLKRTKTKPRTK